MNSALQTLIVTELLPAHAGGEVTYTTAVQSETPPTTPTNGGQLDPGQRWRFARVEAHSGDLVVSVRKPGAAQATPGTGHFRIFAGTAEWLQLVQGAVLDICSVGASATGAVIWGR